MRRSWTMPRVCFPVGWSSLRTTETSAPRATSLRFRPSMKLTPFTASSETSFGFSFRTTGNVHPSAGGFNVLASFPQSRGPPPGPGMLLITRWHSNLFPNARPVLFLPPRIMKGSPAETDSRTCAEEVSRRMGNETPFPDDRATAHSEVTLPWFNA